MWARNELQIGDLLAQLPPETQELVYAIVQGLLLTLLADGGFRLLKDAADAFAAEEPHRRKASGKRTRS